MILIYSPHITKADGMDSQDINIVDDMSRKCLDCSRMCCIFVGACCEYKLCV